MTYSPLDLIENFLRRFVAYPSRYALVAHVLWIIHTHLIECWDTTPRLAFMSQEKASGKTRALEVTQLFVPGALMAFNASPAAMVRLIHKGGRTVLLDEIDSVFGSARAQEGNLDLRSVLNSGYRKGAVVPRCKPNTYEVEELNAFSPVALAGLRDLPDTLASRSIVIRMKRRAPDEEVESFRIRYAESGAKTIREAVAEWCSEKEGDLLVAEPRLPEGVEDRNADLWEPLLAIADAAGGDWPRLAREAAVYLTKEGAEETVTSGVELLQHIKEAFGDEDRITTKTLLDRLINREELPWADIRGKDLNDRGLAQRLKGFGLKSKDVRFGETVRKGFESGDFADAWRRYLPSGPATRDKGNTRYNNDNENNFVADVADVADTSRQEAEESGRDCEDPFAGLKDRRRALDDNSGGPGEA